MRKCKHPGCEAPIPVRQGRGRPQVWCAEHGSTKYASQRNRARSAKSRRTGGESRRRTRARSGRGPAQHGAGFQRRTQSGSRELRHRRDDSVRLRRRRPHAQDFVIGSRPLRNTKSQRRARRRLPRACVGQLRAGVAKALSCHVKPFSFVHLCALYGCQETVTTKDTKSGRRQSPFLPCEAGFPSCTFVSFVVVRKP